MRIPEPLLKWWRDLLSPPPDESVVEWAGRSFTLEQTADKGPFSVRRRPYMREPLERHKHPRCRVLVLCWGTQLGKTITVYIGRFFRNRVFGYSCLIVLPSIGVANRMAKTIILPLLRSSPVMREIIPPYRHAIQSLIQSFTNCYNIITGSNSPANLAGQPVPDTLGDETDKYDEGSEKETAATNLIPQRTKSFSYSLNAWASSPSKPTGFIWGALHSGDHRRFCVWCPGCGKHHTLDWEQFRHPEEARKANGKWDFERVANETWHECPHGCGYRFREADKHRAYAAEDEASRAYPGRKWEFRDEDDFKAELARLGPDEMRRTYPVFWLPTNDDAAPGWASYHLPSWYSPDSKCSLGAVRVQWLIALASGKVQDVQDFYNQTRAEAFDVSTWGIGAVTDLPKGSYALLDAWDDAVLNLTSGLPVRCMALDRQQASFWCVVRTLGQDGSTRLYWEGELPTFDACSLKAKELGCQSVVCDVGYRPKESMDECLDRDWIAMWAEDKQNYPEIEPPSKEFPKGRVVNKLHRWTTYTAASGRKCPVLRWASQGGQDQLAAMIAGKTQGKWTVCAEPSNNYVTQMRTHYYGPVKGRNIWTKRDPKADDHLWDCETELAVWFQVAEIVGPVQA